MIQYVLLSLFLKKMYAFVSKDGVIFNTPDAYIISKKNMIEWGDTLNVWSVYTKGSRPISDHHTIQARFYHEGSYGSLDSTYWVGEIGVSELLNTYKIVYFDLGPNHPRYFLTKDDLSWYITNIYDLHQPFVNDEYPSED